MSVNVAWAAFKASTRGLFWSLVAWALGAIDLKQKAARELTILYPASGKALFDSGYALFVYDFNRDDWMGTWREPDARPGTFGQILFRVYDWQSVPWHEVKFTDRRLSTTSEYRAVELEYARKHLAPEQAMRAAA